MPAEAAKNLAAQFGGVTWRCSGSTRMVSQRNALRGNRGRLGAMATRAEKKGKVAWKTPFLLRGFPREEGCSAAAAATAYPWSGEKRFTQGEWVGGGVKVGVTTEDKQWWAYRRGMSREQKLPR